MIKCLLTELGRAGRENIWPEGQIFSRPARPNSVNKYIFFTRAKISVTKVTK